MPDPTSLHALGASVRSSHAHVLVSQVNDHQVVLAVNEVPYPWHVHEASDELFVVLEGRLTIGFSDGTAVDLGPMDTYLVPRGTIHRTTPRGRCVNLVIENVRAGTRMVHGAAATHADAGPRPHD